MASTRNPKPYSQDSTGDRISKLPDSVLHHILSFLPTKDAARTSVLSRQWKFLWTWLPNLHLDRRQISADYASFEPISLQILRSIPFFSITKFRLSCYFDDDLSDTNQDWDSISPLPILSAVVARKIEELDFHMEGNDVEGMYDNPWKLNLGIFSCETLVVLKLRGCFCLCFDSDVQLPSVKVLHLREVFYEDEDSIENIFIGCPVLDDLYIERTVLDNVSDYSASDYRVSSLTLRNLVVVDAQTFSDDQMIYLDAPALEFVTINVTSDLHLKNMDNLKRAVIHINFDWGGFIDIFQALCGVSYLEFICGTHLCQACDYHHIASPLKFPRFNSLVELVLEDFCCFWPILLHILHSCPILQNLTYKTREFGITFCEEPEYWMPPPHVPSCLISHLTTFKYQGFEGSEMDSKFILYILKNSKVLRNMTIQYYSDSISEQLIGALEELLKSERGSTRCLLHLSKCD